MARYQRFRPRVAAALLAATLGAPLVGGCTPGEAPAPTSPHGASTPGSPSAAPAGGLLADLDIEGLDAVAIIDRLDKTPLAERPQGVLASVRPNELVLTDAAEEERTVPMPDDAFYVSLAPYVTQTHECYFHSLLSCVGELRNTEVSVTITDAANGEVVLDKELTTFDNGFLGVWLPRDLDATVTVAYDGKTATAPISTEGDEAATCITTLQLT
ncbi:MAG: CueP family metal-binding protein [Arachnia sp.]